MPTRKRKQFFIGWPLCRKRPRTPVAQLPEIWCITPKARRWIRAIIQYSLLAFVLVILVLWLGEEVEDRRVKSSGDTLYLYETPQVCGLGYGNYNTTMNDTVPLNITTFPSAQAANKANKTIIAHCGACGQCSNPRDIAIYDQTKNTLFGQTVDCAKHGLIWGRKTASKCMQEHVSFTEGCNECWVENIMCDLRYCIFICMWHGLWGQLDESGTDANSPQQLNPCTECDEKRCGPQFVKCAGANRRRSGILSDIERDKRQEVCDSVHPGWWNDSELQAYFERTSDEIN